MRWFNEQKTRRARLAGAAMSLLLCSTATVATALPAVAATGPGTTPTLQTPADGDTVGTAAVLSATSTAPAVQFSVDGVASGAPVAPDGGGVATTTWPTWGLANGGAHTITAADCDGTGCSDPTSPGVTVTVQNDAPSLTNPTPSETTGTALTLSANANGGGVRFLVDGVVKGFDGTAPYSLAVSALSEGAHVAQVVGCDAVNTTCSGPSSAAVSFTARVLHPTINSLSPYRFSPNADGRRDTTTVTYTLPDRETVVYRVYRASDGVTVRGPVSLGALSARTRSLVWNGRTNGGARVADGTYVVRFETRAAVGSGELARGVVAHSVVVDDTPPVLSSVTGSGATFYPYPDSYGDSWTPRVTLSGTPATLYLDITNSHGQRVRRLSASRATAGTYGFTWNGRNSSGAIVTAGTYHFRFWAQDEAGNQRWTGSSYVVYVSAKKLVSKSTTILRAGNSGTIYTTDQSCTGYGEYEDFLSQFPSGVWMDNVCADVQTIFAQYTVAVPAAARYTSIAVSAYGSPSLHAPEHIFGGWWNYASSTWTLGSPVYLAHNDVNAWSSLGGASASGRVSGGHATVAVLVPSVDGDEDYDLGAVAITINYQILQ
jgi:flagellar hook assembly protein FlgD